MTSLFRSPADSWFRELTRIVLIVLFAFAAADKLLHFGGFITAIGSYQILPARTERFAAIFIIMAEFAIALGLLTRRWRQAASLAAILLLTTFTAVYLVADAEEVCGCWFTLTLNMGGPVHILQNLVFIGLSVLTWLDSQPPSSRPVVSSISSSGSHSAAAQESDDGRLGQVKMRDFEFGGKEV
jgi:uncharacterized membrane protein YhaH (DUF805 family)